MYYKTFPILHIPHPMHPSLQQAKRARADKAELLPLPTASSDKLSLMYHLCLARLRSGTGDARCLHTLATMLLFASGILDAGVSGLLAEQIEAAQIALCSAKETSAGSGVWGLNEAHFQALAACALGHDRQLRRASRGLMRSVGNRIAALRENEQRAQGQLS
ncbi:hypothetical protein [Robbsia andropogonis]|uniref:hypothetical protein n=3 Tax=Robbsia andropogonis TaxID=28092 RepID=UPI00209D8C87|nr:hypothetical protein [Robbsia andropogonis]